MKKVALALALLVSSVSFASANTIGKICSSDGFANLRTAPSLNNAILRPIENGYPVRVLSITKSLNRSWAYVYYENDSEGRYGYVSLDLLCF